MAAFWVARARVLDPEAYGAYARSAAAALGVVREAQDARILARGGASRVLEGAAGFDRHVLIQFPNMESAVGFHGSEAYRDAAKLRLGAGVNELVIVKGVE
jgi:uncharacterized protein (DUF1330 family)